MQDLVAREILFDKPGILAAVAILLYIALLYPYAAVVSRGRLAHVMWLLILGLMPLCAHDHAPTLEWQCFIRVEPEWA